MSVGIILGILSVYVGWLVLGTEKLGSDYFFTFSVGLSLWLLGTVFELQFEPGMFDTVFIQIHLIGIIVSTFSMFLFAVRYSMGYSFSPLQIGLIGIVPLVNMVLIVLNPLLELFWSGIYEVNAYGLHFSKLEFGPFLFLHSVYSYSLVIGSAVLFTWLMFKRRRVFTVQGGLLLSVIGFPLIVSFAYTMGFLSNWIVIDPTPVLLAGTQLMFALIFFRTDFYSVTPGVQMLGWSHVSDVVDVGICITDQQGRIVEYNTQFEDAFVGSDEPEKVEDVGILEESGTEFIEHNRSFYSVRCDELEDNRGTPVGSVFTVNDVTDLLESQQQVRVLNRFMRHNLRNKLSAVLLSVERFGMVEAQSVGDQNRIDDNIDRIQRNLNQLLSMSEAAKDVESSVGDDQLWDRDLDSIVEEAIGRLSMDLDGVDISCDIPSELKVIATDNFEIAIEQMLENSISHSVGQDELSIDISVEVLGSECCLQISDDGPGMSDEAVESFRSELISSEVDQLNHGVGLGFGLANWLATQSNGKFRIDDSVEEGSKVEFYLKLAE